MHILKVWYNDAYHSIYNNGLGISVGFGRLYKPQCS